MLCWSTTNADSLLNQKPWPIFLWEPEAECLVTDEWFNDYHNAVLWGIWTAAWQDEAAWDHSPDQGTHVSFLKVILVGDIFEDMKESSVTHWLFASNLFPEYYHLWLKGYLRWGLCLVWPSLRDSFHCHTIIIFGNQLCLIYNTCELINLFWLGWDSLFKICGPGIA